MGFSRRIVRHNVRDNYPPTKVCMTTEIVAPTGAAAMAAFMGGDNSAEEEFTEQNAVKGGACRFVTFLQGGSKPVKKQDPPGCKAGDYLIDGVAYSRLTVQVGPARPKATYWPRKQDGGSGNKEAESFKATSDTFKKISSMNKRKTKGASVGLEYLCWVFEAQVFGIFNFKGNAFNNENHKPLGEARAAGQLAILGAEYCEGGENDWHNMQVVDTIPAEGYDAFPAPTQEDLEAAMEFFMNPPAETPFK